MNVLLVDDSPAARAQTRAVVEAWAEGAAQSCAVHEAAGGVEALRMLSTHAIDVLCVDLHMPDMTGLEVLAFWRARGHTGIAIVVSTDVTARDRAKAFELGAHAVVDKPLASSAFADVVAAARMRSVP